MRILETFPRSVNVEGVKTMKLGAKHAKCSACTILAILISQYEFRGLNSFSYYRLVQSLRFSLGFNEGYLAGLPLYCMGCRDP